jgi:OPT family small oligopeptide transporter
MGISAFVLGIVTITVWDTKLPVWAYLVALAIAGIYVVPAGMLQAITNEQVGLNVITELVVGYFLPGKPVAMMIFKTFGYITMSQALAFVSDLKLGHYMKIPPRLMFLTQTIATLISCFVVVFVQIWMFEYIPNLCHPDNPDKFTCPGVRVFGTASLVWGGIGPARIFNFGEIYYPMLYFFLIGAILPIPFWLAARRWPHSWFKFVNIPVFMAGTGNLPPAAPINYSSWTLVGFIFQYLIRRRNFGWWSRYNYILSAALDSGVAIGAIVIFFSLQFPNNGRIVLNWWGNNVHENTADYTNAPFQQLQSGDSFGPKQW